MRRLFFLKVEVGNWKILSNIEDFPVTNLRCKSNIINSCQNAVLCCEMEEKVYTIIVDLFSKSILIDLGGKLIIINGVAEW